MRLLTVRGGGVLFLVCASLSVSMSQSEGKPLDVFGYFQVTFDHSRANSIRSMSTTNSFMLQQLNTMMSKEFNPDLSSFVNIEIANTYSSGHDWGSLSLQEAWVKYRLSERLNIKAGLLIPTFNNLNEVKNRTPLLPYILRPLVYESLISEIFDFSPYVPDQAFLQIYGYVPVGDVELDFAGYVGNSEPAFINSSAGNFLPRGLDTTAFKLLGGRVGVRYGTAKAGVSATSDKTNQTKRGLGAVQRYRLGFDVSFSVDQLSCEFEITNVLHSMSGNQRARLDLLTASSPYVGNSLNKMFYYGLVNYDFDDHYYGYGGYSYFHDRIDVAVNGGISAYTLGGGYRASESVVIKIQYTRFKLKDNPFVILREDHFMAALSVSF